MTNADKIKTVDVRISLLKTRGETMNYNIIHKLERKKRALQG